MKNKSNNAAYALLKRRPIAVNPALIKLTGSHTAAMFLSQAIYWEETMGREYYKTNEDWQKELYMSEQVFTTARQKASKYISVVKKGLPARNFYKIDWDVLLEALDTLEIEVSSQLENSPHQSPQKVGSLDAIESGVTITETTTKTNNIAKAIGETPKSAHRTQPNTNSTHLTTTTDVVGDEDLVAKGYYEAIKSLALPVSNHNVIRAKIKELKNLYSEEQCIWYLNFMKNDYATWQTKYKPQVTQALDIYSKSNAIIKRLVEDNKKAEVF